MGFCSFCFNMGVNKMIIGFTGSRSLNKANEELLKEFDKIGDKDIVVHGDAVGADQLIKEYAGLNHIEQMIIRPINPSNKLYYLYRNIEIIAHCDVLIAYWDGKSRGTKFTIDYAKARGKEVIIVAGFIEDWASKSVRGNLLKGDSSSPRTDKGKRALRQEQSLKLSTPCPKYFLNKNDKKQKKIS